MDHGGADNFVVQNDGKGAADVFCRIIAKATCAGGIEPEVDRRAAVLVERRLRIDQIFARHDCRRFDHIEYALFVQRRHQLFARTRRSVFVRCAGDDGVERQLGRGAQQRLQLGGRSDTGHLDQDAVGTLTLDRGFACANLVDPAAHDFQRLLHGPLVCRLLFSVAERDGDDVALSAGDDVR